MAPILKPPPEGCPNDGICALTLPRLDEHERELGRHRAALERIGNDLSRVKEEVHDIRTLVKTRDDGMLWIRNSVVSLLAIALLQIFGGIWWASRIDGAVNGFTNDLGDHEARLRSSEREHQDFRNAVRVLSEMQQKHSAP